MHLISCSGRSDPHGLMRAGSEVAENRSGAGEQGGACSGNPKTDWNESDLRWNGSLLALSSADRGCGS